ncbi:microsomal triglyceride transfer protein large subunit isoform X2 [Aphidius gifuensis]|uniref:microsomal triglyceride transfer protein large subunit isoform X2 n=1 Tax=Aphidius gifuensis TaxID=684658 RepID=UPI001CDBC0DC|nr:microsomal triglyceride transfer protein large subunit isoform X2 [Aphidius gifuensis]
MILLFKLFTVIIYITLIFAIVESIRGWTIGHGYKYEITTIVLSRESGITKSGGDVGFQLTGQITVNPVWQDPKDLETILLEIEFTSPQLWIKSRKAPEPEGFIEHSSKLDDASKKPIYILWNNGVIIKSYLGQEETISSSNLKRGIASIFQYRVHDGDYREYDSSGGCNVTYQTIEKSKIRKIKNYCDEISPAKKDEHPNPMLSVNLHSKRITDYKLNSALIPTYIHEFEQHELTLKIKTEVGSSVTSERILNEISIVKGKKIKAKNVNEALADLQPGYREIKMDLQIEPVTCPDTGCQTLEQAIDENREALEDSSLGTAKSAAAFLKLLPLSKEATADDWSRVLKSPRYRTVKTQLLDILGSAGSPTTHQIAMKILRQDDFGDDTERYLWALSMSPLPHPSVIKDILTRSEETLQNDKVSETLAMTAGAMARQTNNPAIIEKTRISLELGLDTCTGDDCRLRFLRGLKNLKSKNSIPILIDYINKGTKLTSIVAWQTLGSLDDKYITDKIKNLAKRTFFQIGGSKKDSTIRTLAADIILNNRPSIDDLKEFLEYLTHHDSMYEVRKYISQRLEQLADKDSSFKHKLNTAITEKSKSINNYHVMAHRGLSTAFTRQFLKSSTSNGSLVTIQEVNSGLLKRGIVDVVLNTKTQTELSVFSLGLFAGGLGNFVSSNNDNDIDDNNNEEDDIATAGMEIGLLGVGIRPFIFFSGQGELMGHVWSGTASEKTPAFQVIANLHHHRELIPLCSGFIADIEVDGALSFDLSGQIQLSLWSRNAQSLVQMNSGIAIRGGFKIKSELVQSKCEFALTIEPKLELSTDVDFSGQVNLCMKLTQPETSMKYQFYKVERIPGSRHKLRKTKRLVLPSPPKSYFLNKKNNEMCTQVFS